MCSLTQGPISKSGGLFYFYKIIYLNVSIKIFILENLENMAEKWEKKINHRPSTQKQIPWVSLGFWLNLWAGRRDEIGIQ